MLMLIELTFPESTNDNELAEEFADFFLSKILNIRQALDDKLLYEPDKLDILQQFSKFKKVNNAEVKNTIMSLSTKSCELDCIPTNILKENIDVIIECITEIINLSLETSDFPLDWKYAIVRPLLKKAGLELTPSNYRPVSNLSFLSKVLEKIVSIQ